MRVECIYRAASCLISNAGILTYCCCVGWDDTMSIRYKLYTRWWFHWNQSKFTLISPHLIIQLGTKLDIMPTHAILGWNYLLHHSLSPKVMHVSAWTIIARFDNFIELKECNNIQPDQIHWLCTGIFDFDVNLIRKQVAKPINDTNYSRSYVTWLVALPTQNGLKILAYNTVTVYHNTESLSFIQYSSLIEYYVRIQ